MRGLRWLLCVAVAVVALAPVGRAQERFGIGLMIGDPSGISWKYHLRSANALSGLVGFSPFDRFRIHVDYLWEARPFDQPSLSLWYGVGGAVGFGRAQYLVKHNRDTYVTRTASMGVGIRMVGAFNFAVPRSPVELGLELAPILIIGPDTGVGVDGGIYVRFYP
ncbi:MAG: hypothetical protein IT282_12530 [Bacteroidetes bacterium]|nr:hypothetical protein [Bacteroidota bacterium]